MWNDLVFDQVVHGKNVSVVEQKTLVLNYTALSC